jgi:hypothetical protein
MLQRCLNSKNPLYKYYGARGIGICRKWHSFKGFYNDMGKIPENMTIERIDNNKGYYKENCKLATQKEQCNNRRTNVFIEYDGVVKTKPEWSRSLGGSDNLVLSRLQRGWSIEKALTTPLRREKRSCA